MSTYTAIFKTTEHEKNCRVWGYGLAELGALDKIIYGNTIDEFMEFTKIKGENHTILFHNLRFYGQFILSWCLENGYQRTTDPAARASNTFNTLISDEGEYYKIEVIFYKKGKNINRVIFLDSMKLIPLKVEELPRAFKLDMQVSQADHSDRLFLPDQWELRDFEKESIKNDLMIVGQAVEYFYNRGYNKMTIGSCALQDYTNVLGGKKTFRRYFPEITPECFADLRQAYRGGYCILNPEFQNKIVGPGIVIDVNSLFSDRMNECPLPYGTPSFFRGQYIYDELYPLYTQMFRCMFELKPGKLPMVQIRYGGQFAPAEYLTSSDDMEVTLCLNSVDMELFLENYEVYNIEYIAGWKFQEATGLFSKYIEKWTNAKIKSKDTENWGMYLLSKLFLVSLYGKFGAAVRGRSKLPYLDQDKIVRFEDGPLEDRTGVYLPVASFTTSYARNKTIRAAQMVMDRYAAGESDIQFIYADTDSLHCLSPGQQLPEGLEIDQTKLGAWKFESKFTRAKYLRAKCYIQESTEDVFNSDPEYKLKVTIAGMPDTCKKQVNFKNFKVGETFTGNMKYRAVRGGVIMDDNPFTIH